MKWWWLVARGLVLATMLMVSPATSAVAAVSPPGSLEKFGQLLTEFEQAIQATHAAALRQFDQTIRAEQPAAPSYLNLCQDLFDSTARRRFGRVRRSAVEAYPPDPGELNFYRTTIWQGAYY